MFNNRLFRTTDELDLVRGPLLASYLRFEILLWSIIALLSLVAWIGTTFLPTPETSPENYGPTLLVLTAFCVAVIAVFIAVWRFKKWAVYVVVLWTLLLVVGGSVSLISPERDWLFLIALLGWIIARSLVLLFEVRPKWSYFSGGLW